jgi:GntR family transcriptional regulator, transcriptional repressor for pyruvate dehydrogenase complex
VALKKELLNTKVVREVISLMASGSFADGQRLPAERKLCEQFNVSRGTVRMAISDLEKMGVVKIKPGSGIYVKKVTQRKIPRRILPPNFNSVSLEDIIIARKAIETSAIELACERITPKELRWIESLLSDMERAKDDLPSFLKLDMAFHELLVQTSGNQVLITAFEAIGEYHKYSQIFTSSDTECEDVAIGYHKRILDALKKGKKKLCCKVLNEHFESMLTQ